MGEGTAAATLCSQLGATNAAAAPRAVVFRKERLDRFSSMFTSIGSRGPLSTGPHRRRADYRGRHARLSIGGQRAGAIRRTLESPGEGGYSVPARFRGGRDAERRRGRAASEGGGPRGR